MLKLGYCRNILTSNGYETKLCEQIYDIHITTFKTIKTILYSITLNKISGPNGFP